MKPLKTLITLAPNQTAEGIGLPSLPLTGAHPPLNLTVVRLLIKIMFPYSPRKNKAKAIAEYSTLYPETLSASASGKSNGCRFVSAKIDTKNLKALGNLGTLNHTPSCARTLPDKFPVRAHILTHTTTKPIDTSYDTICAADRLAPLNAYFEFDAHPATTIPYTANDDTANLYLIPKLGSAYTLPSPTGITAQPIKAKTKVTLGAPLNNPGFADAGTTVSFKSNFNPSANGVNLPYLPTAFGP